MSKTSDIQKLFAEMLKDCCEHTNREVHQLAVRQHILTKEEDNFVRAAISQYRAVHPEVKTLGRGRYQLEPDVVFAAGLAGSVSDNGLDLAIAILERKLDEVENMDRMNVPEDEFAKAREDYARITAFAERTIAREKE